MTMIKSKKLSVTEAAELLEVGETAVRTMLRNGSLPCVKVGRKHVIFRADVEAMVAGKLSAVPQADFAALLREHRRMELRTLISAYKAELEHLENLDRPMVGRGVRLVDQSG